MGKRGLKYLKSRARWAGEERFGEAMSKVPAVPPVPGDEL